MKQFSVLLLTLPVLLTGCRHGNLPKEVVRTVKLTEATGCEGERSISFPGKLKASSEANLAFRISGPIAEIPVTVGQQVRKGETVARMDSRDYALQLAATEAEYKQVKAEAERVIRLYEKQSVSENDYDKAVSGLQQITAKYNAHRNALADTRLTAPFDGYVQKIHYDAGETVAAGMPVVSLISSSAPEVEINIPAGEFIRSDEFETYRCSSEIYPDREFPLELVSISRKANLNQLYTARLRFLPTGPDTPLTPGMSVMVTIGLRGGTTGAVKIPLSAMLEHDGTPAVWVYNPADSTVALRKIRPSAISRDGILTVTGGLHAGEQVVTAGIHALKENDKVKPLPTATSTNVGGLL